MALWPLLWQSYSITSMYSVDGSQGQLDEGDMDPHLTGRRVKIFAVILKA